MVTRITSSGYNLSDISVCSQAEDDFFKVLHRRAATTGKIKIKSNMKETIITHKRSPQLFELSLQKNCLLLGGSKYIPLGPEVPTLERD
jgi:hypothetical protein